MEEGGDFTNQNETVIYLRSPKVPESYKISLRVSSSVKKKSSSTPPSGREWAKAWKAKVGGDRKKNGIKILSSSKYQRSSGMVDERVKDRLTSCL